ncbi:MAG: hypothetical protein P1U70_06200 [Saprospiraceae bacterium]|jgi:hypothetical protein|nr:hypothetical protein [Saprospiraceae bacterium]
MKFFYPGGSMVFKRLARLCIIFTIGFNLFLDKIQNHLFETGEYLIEVADTLSQTSVYSADLIEEYIFPVYDYIEDSRFYWIFSEFNLPERAIITQGIGNIHRFRDTLNLYSPLFRKVALIIKWTSLFMWIPIGLALLWLCFDLFIGKAKLFVFLMLVITVPVNMYVFSQLNILFELPVEIDSWLEKFGLIIF